MKNTSRKPYIYKVTNQETGRYYIGSQCSGKTVGVNYFTSSHNKEFKEGFKNYGEEKYKIEIIKEFEDPKKCVKIENVMIRDHMLKKDGLCLNRAYFCNGEKIFSRVGTHHSEETRKKMRKPKKGHTGRNKGFHHSEEVRKRISEGHKGFHHSEEAKQKISLASPRRIKIHIEGTVFDSLADASKYYNVVVGTISYWIKTKKHNTFYIEK